ncbi:MAG: hypothetical protein ACRC1P_09690 [Cellulosilyticaceae bacterium]
MKKYIITITIRVEKLFGYKKHTLSDIVETEDISGCIKKLMDEARGTIENKGYIEGINYKEII